MRTPKLFSSKFVKLIKAWNEEEIKSFELWLRSPWCNSNKNLIRLMDRMKKYHPDFNDSKVTKEKLFAKILPNGKYSDRRMNNILSEAYLAAEKFMVFQRFEKEQSLQKDLLTQEFQSRYLDDWFFRDIQKEIDRLEKKEVKDWEDHLDLFRMYRRVYHHPDSSTRMSEKGAEIFVKMGEELNLLYLLEKAVNIKEKGFRNKIVHNESNEIEKEKELWISNSQFIDHPSINLYKLRFSKMAMDVELYKKIRTQLFNEFDSLNELEKKIQLMFLINDSISFIKKGELEITEMLPLYKLGLETRVLFQKGKITKNTYTTIVIASNTKGDFSYTIKFIDEYSKFLRIDIREDCTKWALAHTYYWQQDLEKCIRLLNGYDFKIPYFQLLTRILGCQCYFDLFLKDDSYQSFLFNYLDTFERRLNREKIWSENVKKSLLRFVQLSRILAKSYIDIDFNSEKIDDLFEGEKNVQALNWLKEKQMYILEKRKGQLT